jgi:hypothetical protein
MAMSLRTWRFFALLLAALALTMESAHVLELPQKLQYDAQMYAAVNGTLYRYFALVGGCYQVASIVTAGVLVFMVRRRRQALTWTIAGAVSLLAAFVIWLAVVAPVNQVIADTLRVTPAAVPSVWMELRKRWEFGHAAGFAVQVIGFSALLMSLLVDTPRTTGRMPRSARNDEQKNADLQRG